MSASASVQWKGTDVCLDFECVCGEYSHFDGFFAYAIECPYCERVYEMSPNIAVTEVSKDTDLLILHTEREDHAK